MVKRAKGAQEKAKASNYKSLKTSGNLIEPGILVLLKETPSHGYDLLGRFAGLGIRDNIEIPTIYHILRGMEKEGLLKSNWVTEKTGPAKRVYEITLKAKKAVGNWANVVETDIRKLEGLLKQLRQVAPN